MAPLAKWCNADYIQKRVKRVVGAENRLELDDGSSLKYLNQPILWLKYRESKASANGDGIFTGLLW